MNCITIVVLTNGYGHPDKGMIITIVNHIFIRIPFSLLLSETKWELDGIWITLLVSFMIAFLCAFYIDRLVQRKK